VILVDTSVWIDHLRAGDATMAALLDAGKVATHPFVIGEIALGILRKPGIVLALLQRLPAVVVATDPEVLRFIEARSLGGCGIGYIDTHLLAAVRLTPGSTLWTRDRRLREVADRLGLAQAR